jgi:hypothetical protein
MITMSRSYVHVDLGNGGGGYHPDPRERLDVRDREWPRIVWLKN